MALIGRIEEQRQFNIITAAESPSLVAVYGRRRVGKTFLIKEFYKHQFTFYATGLANANTQAQLIAFHGALQEYFKIKDGLPANWMAAFGLLKKYLSKQRGKRILFLDELPWLDTPRSDFLTGFEWFWNSWASSQKYLKCIVCGSAASWMITKLLNNTGGLYNRVTHRFKIEPFTLAETEMFLQQKNIVMSRYQITKLYMALGGIPYYLDQVQKGDSDATAIERLCFSQSGVLRNEFQFIFSSLFKDAGKHELIIQKIYELGRQANREALVKATKIESSGDFSKKLNELIECGFVSAYVPFGLQSSKKIYVLSDYFSLFYFKFMSAQKKYSKGMWVHKIMDTSISAWHGYSFELLCFNHIDAIVKALGISGIYCEVSPWLHISKAGKAGAQIDLILDRSDKSINICEIKFSEKPYTITKNYDLTLRKKAGIFENATGTRKALLCTMITTFGLQPNAYANSYVQASVTLDDLFK